MMCFVWYPLDYELCLFVLVGAYCIIIFLFILTVCSLLGIPLIVFYFRFFFALTRRVLPICYWRGVK